MLNISLKCNNVLTKEIRKRVWRYQGGNQNP